MPPMPTTPSHAGSGTALPPVPVAVLLPTAPPNGLLSAADLPTEPRRLSAETASRLIAVYSRIGDRVIDADASPVVALAAAWLDRRATAFTDSDWMPKTSCGAAGALAASTGLVIVTLPRPGATDLIGVTEWMRRCRTRIQPGGFLVASLPASRHGEEFVDYSSTVITAARAAGLIYHQHLVDVVVPLPEFEPRAAADTAGTVPPRLVRGRHARVHRDLYVFADSRAGASPNA